MKIKILAVLIIVMASSALGQKSKLISHDDAMRTLKACQERRLPPECDENPIYEVIKRYERGDTSLLKPLLRTHEFSDGALAEELDEFYGRQLWHNTIRFLTALSQLPSRIQEEVCYHTFVDGKQSAMNELDRRLRRIINKKIGISHVARLCIDAVPDGKTYPNTNNK